MTGGNCEAQLMRSEGHSIQVTASGLGEGLERGDPFLLTGWTVYDYSQKPCGSSLEREMELVPRAQQSHSLGLFAREK